MVDTIFESPGEWWLPAPNPRRIPGMLRIDGKGSLTIQLFETFDDEPTSFGAPVRHPVIHGSLHESPLGGGQEITHFDSFATRRSLRSNGTSAESLVANRSYVGDEHLEAPDSKFAIYRASVAGLSAWLSLSAVAKSVNQGNVSIEVKRPSAMSVALAGARMRFVKGATVSFSDDEVIVREQASVEFALDEPTVPDDFSDALWCRFGSLRHWRLGR